MQVQKWLLDTRASFKGELQPTLDKLKEEYGIISKTYSDSIILNYDLVNCSNTDSGIVAECRGLQLSIKDFSVISRAFNRFLNYGERNTDKINFDNQTVVYDKIDGSLVILYYSQAKESWQVRTRGTAFAEATVSSIHSDVAQKLEKNPITFRDLILSAMEVDNLNHLDGSLDKGKSYVFELVSPENRVITIYPERALYYLSTFTNSTAEEEDYAVGYENISQYIKCKQVPTHSFNSIGNILKIVKELPPLDEGYVVRNSKNERVKIKNPSYVALHLLHNNGVLTDKRIVELLETGEDSEFLSYFAAEKSKFDRIKENKQKLFASVRETYDQIKDIESQKDYAVQATKYKYSGLLFQMRRGLTVEEVWAKLSLSAKEKLLL